MEFNQGKKFIDNKNKYNNLITSENIKNITNSMGILDQLSLFSSKPKSLIEGYRNNDVYNAAMAEIENLESKFTIKLGDYKEKYKKYLNELMLEQNTVFQSRKNQVVKVNDGEKDVYYYINNYGVARKFTNQAWLESIKVH